MSEYLLSGKNKMEDIIRVLYICNEPDILVQGKQRLERNGEVAVITSPGPIEALELLTSLSFDIIVTDTIMQGMNETTFQALLATRQIKIPYILFLAGERDDVVNDAVNAGVAYYLRRTSDIDKSFEELETVIHEHITRQRFNERISIKQKKVAGIIDYLPDPMFAIDNEGIVIAWNLAMEELTGTHQRDIIGRGDHAYSRPLYGTKRTLLIDLIFHEDELISGYSSFQKKGQTISAESFIPTLFDGRGAYVQVYVTPLFDENGNLTGAIESIRNISDRKSAEYDLVRKNEELQAAYEEISASEEELRSNLDVLVRKEEQLTASKEKYKSLYVNMVEGTALHEIIFDDQGRPVDYRVVDVNPAFENIIGISREQAIGKTSRELFGVSKPPYLDIYAKVAMSGEPVSFEVYFQPMNKFFFISAYCPYKGSFASTFIDLTESRRSAEELLTSETRLKEAQNLALIGNWELDLTNNHLKWSDVIYTIFEVEPEQFTDSYEFFLQAIHPDDREAVDMAFTSSIKSQTPYQVEHRLLMPDGRIKYVIERCQTIYDPLGSPLLSVGTVQDITEWKKTEIKLKETNEYLESLINIANVPIIVWNSSFQIIRLNHAFENLIGRSAEEIIGSSLEFLFPPDQAERSMQLFRSTLDGVWWDTTEIELLHRDGSLKIIQWNSATLYSSDGVTPVATIAQGHDVTRERRLERERDIALSQIKHNLAYLAILNDEIRNPLNNIVVLSDLTGNNELALQISNQVQRIDLMVSHLDKRWVESEKILDYLRKHHQVSFTEGNGAGDRKTTWDIAELLTESDKAVHPDPAVIFNENESELLEVLDSIDALVYVADVKTYDLIFMNRHARSVLKNIAGEKCYDYLNPDKGKPCPTCLQTESFDQCDHSGLHNYYREYVNPGNNRWYGSQTRIMRWNDGRKVRVVTAIDITHNKEMELKLSQEKSFLLFAERVLQMGSWRYDFNTGLTSWSDGLYDLYGLDNAHRSTDEGQHFFSMIHPEDKERVLQIQQLINVDRIPRSIDCRILRSDGSLRWIHIEGKREYDKNGNIISISGITRDVTEHVLEKRDYLLTKQKLSGIISGNHTGTWEWNFQTQEYKINKEWAEILGYSISELSPLSRDTWELLIHPADISRMKESLSRHCSGELSFFECEIRFRHKSGKWIWTSVTASIISRDTDGLPEVVFGIYRDITWEREVLTRLKESENRYKTISEMTTDFVFSCKKTSDHDCVIEWITGKVELITGYSEEELLSLGCLKNIVLPDDLFVFDDLILSLPAGASRNGNLRIVRKDGSIRWIDLYSSDIFTGDHGISSQVYCGCRDITRLIETEKALRNSEKRYQNLVQNLPGCVIVHRDGIILFVNQSGVDMMGRTLEELIGTRLFEYLPAESIDIISKVSGKLTQYNKVPPFEISVISSDGRRIFVEVRSLIILYEGKPAVISVFSDISWRKEIEDELRRSETRYRNFIEHANEAIVVAQNGYLSLINPRMEHMSGYTREELMSVPYVSIIHPDDQNLVIDSHMKRIHGENPPCHYVFRLVKKNGEITWVEISAVLIEWEGAPATLNFLSDVSERVQAESALRESNKKLRLLTGLTRHDIFNQLSSIDLLQRLAIESHDIEKIHYYIRNAMVAGEKIERIIGFTRDYEDFGIVSSGWERIYSIISSATNEVTLHAITIENMVPENLEIYVDPIIRKVFTTLIENAVRHGGQITGIWFFCENRGLELVIVCEDDGTGIPDEEKEKVFEHGFGTHTGIGLFLAREILSITGLSIQECGSYGSGARFEILVPKEKFRLPGII